MIYEHDCYVNLIEINIKNIPNKFIRFNLDVYSNFILIYI